MLFIRLQVFKWIVNRGLLDTGQDGRHCCDSGSTSRDMLPAAL